MKNPDWQKELSEIPSMACVAFAARCARRVQPLFLISWPQAPERLYHLLDGAVATVEESSLGIDRKNSTFAFNGMSAVKAAYTVGAEQAAAVASTVACASQSMASIGYGDLCLTHAAQAADYAVKVFELGNEDGRAEGLTMLIGAMMSDVEWIVDAAASGLLDDDSVSSEFFGPLWPDGEPDYVFQLPTLED